MPLLRAADGGVESDAPVLGVDPDDRVVRRAVLPQGCRGTDVGIRCDELALLVCELRHRILLGSLDGNAFRRSVLPRPPRVLILAPPNSGRRFCRQRNYA